MSNDEKYTVKTSVGKFRVEKTNTHLRVGGSKFCVEIKFNIDPITSELQWLITKDGGCELDGKDIHGSDTIHLLNLSFTLLKLYTNTPNVSLLDNSKFDCTFNDGSKTTIFMNKYYYLFHGGTYYDINTNAVPIDPSQGLLYNETKYLYNDPSMMKESFDFQNPLLQKELMPLYKEASTWKEFASILHKKYNKEELCRKVAPWYTSAVALLTQYRMLPEYWRIDISKIEHVPFTKLSSVGGTRKRKYKNMNSNKEYKILSPNELYNKNI